MVSPRSHATSRGFDGLEIDDFHGPERDGNRSPDSDSRSGWAAVRRLERIRGEEERADQRDQEARGASGGNRSPLPQTTLAYYVQSVEESQRSAITRLEKMMFPTVPKFEDGSLLIHCKDWLGD